MSKNILAFVYSLVIALTTFTIAMACGCGCMGANCGASNATPSQVQQTENKVQCPVMKTWIIASEVTDKTEYNGKTYYFCCPGCKAQFEKEPAKYIEN